MEPPPVQYARTSDGVSIAWGELGDGPPLLWCNATPFFHVEGLFTVYGPQFEAIVPSFHLVTFDARGTGMSERDVDVVSLDTLFADAEAVIEAAALDRFIVYGDAGNILAVALAVRLAVAFPDRVTHLVLESPCLNMQELADTAYGRTGAALAELDWTVFTQTLVRILVGLDETSEVVKSLAAAIGGWVDPAVGVKYAKLWDTVELTEIVGQVRRPTLIMRQDPYFVPTRACQRFAAKIPGAQFRQYSDPTYAQVADLIRTFVAPPSAPAPRDFGVAATGAAVILFTDIVDSTALTERMGDAAFRAASRKLDEAIRRAIRDAGGTPVDGKVLGDGIMGVFAAAAQGIRAARACVELSGRSELQLHIGLHAGDVIREEGNVYGGAVNLASRICSLCEPGEILVSQTVRDLGRTSAGVEFADRGEHVLKGIEDGVRLYEVRWRE